MPTKINNDPMCLEIDDRDIATAELCESRRGGCEGAWIVSSYPGRLFTRNQAITAAVLTDRLAAGFGGAAPFVLGWQEELGLAEFSERSWA